MNSNADIESSKFPIGTFIKPDIIDKELLRNWIRDLETFPDRLKKLVHNLTAEQLGWRYRQGGWSIKQVVHHCADSHMNSLMRFKLALTEEQPVIRPYMEAKWAELDDSLNCEINDSIKILQGVHSRMVMILKALTAEELKKEFIHPEHGTRISIEENIGIYAWHSNHHLAHIEQALALRTTK